jgi:hypothetical protein
MLEAYAPLTCRSEGKSGRGEGSGAVGITVTREQREDVERQLRRTDLTRRVRERTRDGQSGGARRRGRAHRAVEWALGGPRGAVAGALCRGWGGGAA